LVSQIYETLELTVTFRKLILPATIEIPEDISDVVLAGYHYWRSKAGARFAPTWKEIDPADIVELLPNVVVIHVLHNPLDFIERITGQYIVDNSYRNGMHIKYRDFSGRGPESAIWKALESVVNQGEPNFQEIPYVGPNRGWCGR
jgi:hypothetical protein